MGSERSRALANYYHTECLVQITLHTKIVMRLTSKDVNSALCPVISDLTCYDWFICSHMI